MGTGVNIGNMFVFLTSSEGPPTAPSVLSGFLITTLGLSAHMFLLPGVRVLSLFFLFMGLITLLSFVATFELRGGNNMNCCPSSDFPLLCFGLAPAEGRGILLLGAGLPGFDDWDSGGAWALGTGGALVRG